MYSLYIDAFSGVSGNMFIGALLDLGVPKEYLLSELEKLGIDGYEIKISKVSKSGISATYVDVLLTSGHGHHHGEHGHCEHHEARHGDADEHGDCCHGHHSSGNNLHHHHHRGLSDITEIINKSALGENVKKTAIDIFTVLGRAEAKVHGVSLEEVHFHEVGAVDTIVDIVGTVICLEYLKVGQLFVSKVRTGYGFVKCAHGMMPVPAPATAELLHGIPNYKGDIEKELATPTGVAILAALAKVTDEIPEGFVSEKTGYGAGGYDLNIPNALRVFWGKQGCKEQPDDMIVIETNIDDMNPQFYGHIMNMLFAAGASDVWITPILMKKGRPACLLSALSKKSLIDEITKTIFSETSTLGFRYYEVKRQVLERHMSKIKLPYGEVHIKYGKLDGRIVNIAPEFDDCSNLSAITGKPLKTIWQDAMQAAEKYGN